MTRKTDPSRVHHGIAVEARRLALAEESDPKKAWQSGWTQYILVHFRATGNLAPGCDMKDWVAWWNRETARGGGG